ncbi:MAG: hypothetical protein ACLFUV_02645 [Methanomassiliicoccales archaeon]
MKCMPAYAKLEPDAVSKVMDTEKDLGVVLIAYEKPLDYTVLSGEDLERIQELEKDLGVKLVAYD